MSVAGLEPNMTNTIRRAAFAACLFFAAQFGSDATASAQSAPEIVELDALPSPIRDQLEENRLSSDLTDGGLLEEGVTLVEEPLTAEDLPYAFNNLSTENLEKFEFTAEAFASLRNTGWSRVIVEFEVDSSPIIDMAVAADDGTPTVFEDMDAARMAEVSRSRILLFADLLPELSAELPRRERAHLISDGLESEADGEAIAAALPDTQAGERLTYAYAYTPMFAANLTSQELLGLANDPRVVRIHEDRASEPLLPRSTAMMEMDVLHTANYRGTGRAVAILDNGFRVEHPMYVSRVQRGWCFSSPGAGQSSLCTTGSQGAGVNTVGACSGLSGCVHGTHVASTAAGGWRYNGPLLSDRLSSVAPYSVLWLVQVFHRTSDNRTLSYSSDQQAALEALYAARNSNLNNPLAAINMSIGGGGTTAACTTHALRPIIQLLRNAGVATIIAAGNERFINGVTDPGCIPEAITVGAVGFDGKVARYSNQAPMVDVLAPGGDRDDPETIFDIFNNDCLKEIVAAAPSLGGSAGPCTYGSTSGGHVRAIQGTSMAAPHVAGLVAVLRSVWPQFRIDDIELALEQTGRTVADHRGGGTYSVPLVNARLAFNNLVGTQTRVRPANDNFLAARGISGNSQTSSNNVNATFDAGEPIFNSSQGRHTIWWRWTAPSSGRATFTTDGSAIDTILGAYSGTVVNDLTFIAQNDDGGAGAASRLEFNVTAGQIVYLAVDGFGSATGNITMNSSMPDPGRLAITSTATWSKTVYQGRATSSARTYTLRNTGGTALTYSVSDNRTWVTFSGATSGTINPGSSTTLRGFMGSGALSGLALGNHSATITVDPSTGSNITLPVAVFVRPENDLFSSALPLSGTSATASGSNVNATAETNEPRHGTTTAGTSTVWWYWRAPVSGNVVIDTNGSNYDTTLAAYSGNSVSTLTLLDGDDDGGTGTRSRVTFDAVGGRLYRIAVAGYSTNTGTIALNLAQSPTTETLTVRYRGLGSGDVSVNGQPCVRPSCTVEVTQGSTAELVSQASAGSEFAGWIYGDCSNTTASTCSLNMSESRTVWARFSQASVADGRIVAAVLPGARSGYVGGPPMTIFMSVVSRATTPAQGCRVAEQVGAPATLAYRELDANRQLVDGPNSPMFDLPAGGSVNLVIALTPTSTTSADGYVFRPQITCENANLTEIVGVNTVQISIGLAPVPDLVSIGATVSGDGVIRIPTTGNRINFMSAAALNIGSGDGSGNADQATITMSADTGSATLPVTIQVCETGTNGACLAARSSSVTSVFNGTTARTFAVFVRINEGAFIPFSPANNRVFMRFRDANGVLRSSYSAAVSSPNPNADIAEGGDTPNTAANDNVEILLD
jgi:Subtilase family